MRFKIIVEVEPYVGNSDDDIAEVLMQELRNINLESIANDYTTLGSIDGIAIFKEPVPVEEYSR